MCVCVCGVIYTLTIKVPQQFLALKQIKVGFENNVRFNTRQFILYRKNKINTKFSPQFSYAAYPTHIAALPLSLARPQHQEG